MRKIVILIFIFLAVISAESKNLTVHFKDGTKSQIPLEDIIKITFDAEQSVSRLQNVFYKLDLSSYPNPFSHSVKIKYEIPSSGDVVIELFDITGEKVYSNSVGFLPAGKYEFLLEENSLPPGRNYQNLICRIKCNKASGSTKLIKLK